MPIAVAYGEGRAEFENSLAARKALDDHKVVLRYLDHYGEAAEEYPLNPNGSALGITGLTSDDGRFTIMMPHPKRVFRSVQNSWHPDEWGKTAPGCACSVMHGWRWGDFDVRRWAPERLSPLRTAISPRGRDWVNSVACI